MCMKCKSYLHKKNGEKKNSYKIIRTQLKRLQNFNFNNRSRLRKAMKKVGLNSKIETNLSKGNRWKYSGASK